MIVTQIAHIIADYVVFLELTDEEELNLDTAVTMMEALADQLENLDKDFLRELIDAFAAIAERIQRRGAAGGAGYSAQLLSRRGARSRRSGETGSVGSAARRKGMNARISAPQACKSNDVEQSIPPYR